MIERTILDEVSLACKEHPCWSALDLFPDASSARVGVHVAVMVEPFLSNVLEGKKTIESRFSKPLISPYQRVSVGDVVLLKAGPIVASFRVASTEFIELDPDSFLRLRSDYSSAICADAAFWDERRDKRYATLLGISDVRVLAPIRISKSDRRGWLTLRTGNVDVDADQLSLI